MDLISETCFLVELFYFYYQSLLREFYLHYFNKNIPEIDYFILNYINDKKNLLILSTAFN